MGHRTFPFFVLVLRLRGKMDGTYSVPGVCALVEGSFHDFDRFRVGHRVRWFGSKTCGVLNLGIGFAVQSELTHEAISCCSKYLAGNGDGRLGRHFY